MVLQESFSKPVILTYGNHEHDQDSDEDGSESTEYFSPVEEYIDGVDARTEGLVNTLKDATPLPVPRAEDDVRVGSSSTMDELAKNTSEQGSVTCRDGVGVPSGASDPVKSMEDASSKVQVLQSAHNFNINNSQFNTAGRDVHVTNNYSDASLTEITYAHGAGIDTTKACLEGTRTEILAEIKSWITTADESAPRVLWLSGLAGTGKSAIAHTIARWWMLENGGIGSCFCFNRQAATRHEKLFATIARDLAARIPNLKCSLIEHITNEPALASTTDVTQQWRRLLQEPLTNPPESIVGPVLIVIDALDESGEPVSRRHILPILAKDAAKLPSNFRILVTSRPLPDISKIFHDTSGVRPESMDKISAASTERDIQLYISCQLEDVEDFGNPEFIQLARKSDGLFEWARLACEYIKYAQGFMTELERFEELMHAGEGKELLDNVYTIILRSILGDRPNGSTIDRFRSVLRIVLSTLEPVTMTSLDVLHCAAWQDRGRYNVMTVLRPLGSLLSGVASSQSMTVRPLHSTFHEFLTTRDRSGPFFVDVEDVNVDLARACLQVMQQHLHFNICKLESSYVRNSEIADLGGQIKNCIKPYLAYSCQFWAHHIKPISFHEGIASQVEAFLLNEKMLFWLEALGLLRLMNMVPTMLSIVASWLQNMDSYEDAEAAARDGIRFARMIGGIVTESAPHLYLSGLPFLPKNSILSRHLKLKFTGIPRIAFGSAIDWVPLQLSISAHTRKVTSVAFSPDGKRIVSGADNGTIYIWDSETGLQMGDPLSGHTYWVKQVTFSPDGKRIASCSTNDNIYIWDAETGLQIGNIPRGQIGRIHSVIFSPDGKKIASTSDKTIYIWDTMTLQMLSSLRGHTGKVNSIAFSPDGKKIASGSDDKTIGIWNAVTGLQMVNFLRGHADWVRSVVFSPDGKRIVSGSYDKTIYIWDAKTGLQIGNPLRGHTGRINSVSFSPDGKRIASGSHDKTICIWNPETGLQIGNSLRGHTGWVNSVSFSPDGKRIVSGSDDKTICIWDAVTGLQVDGPLGGHINWVKSVSFSPDGKKITSSSYDKTICIWDAETGVQLGNPLRHTDWVNSVAFSPDGKKIVSCSDDKTICIWDAETGLQIGNSLTGHTAWINTVTFSPDGKKIASGSDDGAIYIWDAEVGLQMGNPLRGHSDRVNSVAFSPDGKRIVSGSDDESIYIWDSETGVQIGNPLREHTGGVISVAFSPDGKKIATGSNDTTIYIWDAKTGLQMGNPLKGHTGSVNSVSFSFDGKRIVSGSSDETICIWDVETGLQIGNPLRGHTNRVLSVAFSPDGKSIVSGSQDHTVCVWNAVTTSPVVHRGNSLTSGTNVNVIKSPSEVHIHSGPFGLLCDTIELQQDWKEHLILNTDGWITGPQGHLLMWIPPSKRIPFLWPKMHLIIPKQAVELDLSSMAHGHMWDKCYDG